ncbi:hypothetical protein LTR49_026905 [Elasticomyces elasticus]|nr:hypothetical protein LTR49_026905 [Elasticomyces elasticus]KAK5737865.1 hypothetical protein LTS12_025755 [Elasticomyces elasticus]
MNMLIALQFMAGAWGITPITNGGGNRMPRAKRGSVMAIWAIGPLLGKVLSVRHALVLSAEVVKRDAQIGELKDAKLSLMRSMEERQKEPIANHKAVVKERKAAEEHEMDAEIALSNAEIKRGKWKTLTEEQQNLINRLMASRTMVRFIAFSMFSAFCDTATWRS